MGEWVTAEGHERPTGRMERVSKQPRHFSEQNTRGQICRSLNVDADTLDKMIEAGEVVIVPNR